jgi:hypothetical protein
MSTTKRITGDYNIISLNPSDGDNVNITTHTVNVTGNLSVQGNLTYIDVTKLEVGDPFITVAANNTGTIGTATYQQQGLVTQTSNSTYAGLRFNNSTLEWEISPAVDSNGAPLTAYQAIGTSVAGSVAGPNASIQFHDSGNVFGGNASLTYDLANSQLRIRGSQLFGNIGTTPAALANSVTVYSKAQGSGGTGLYVISPTVDDELVSKSAAIVFSIIF